jgi:hypothetical protein
MAISIVFGGIIIVLIFAVGGIIESKSTMKKSQVIRSIYFYLASLVTLGIVVGSLVYLSNVGLKSWVFTEADPLAYRLGAPPILYFQTSSKTVQAPEFVDLVCTDACTLSNDQATSIAQWRTSYASWLEAKKNPNAQRASDTVAALSFLIVALPFFIIHFRIVQKDAKKEDVLDRSVIRPTYFYFISLAALLMIVIAGGMLINLGLRTWVIKSADETTNLARQINAPLPEGMVETSAVQSVIDCGAKCGIEAETITMARAWQADYQAWQDATSNYNNKQRQAAATIPYVVLGIPLFWYHWSVVRKESREKRDQPSSLIPKV